MKQVVSIVLLAATAWLASAPAQAACLQGKARVGINWSPNGTLGPRLQPLIGTVQPLRGVQLIFTKITGKSMQLNTVTDANGDYSICSVSLPSGTWQPTIRWQDSTSADPRFRFVNTLNGLTHVNVAFQPNVVIPDPPVDTTMNIDFLTGDGELRALANAFAITYEWFETMANKYGQANNPLFNNMPPIQIVNQNTNASAGLDHIRVPRTMPTVAATYLHELGHVLAIQYQSQRNGVNNDWINPGFGFTCDHGSGTPNRPAADALIEGFAEFVARIVGANGSPPTGVGSTTCGQCEVNALNGDPFSAPECGVGSIRRGADRVAAALGDLVDDEQGNSSCRTENVRITVDQVLEVVASFPGDSTEGGARESANTTPPQPPTPGVGNSTLLADQLSLLDFLRSVEVKYRKRTRPIWANSCWQPGDASAALTD